MPNWRQIPPPHPAAPPSNATRTVEISHWATAALAYIDQHHSRSSCQLAQLASELRVSASHLSRQVKQETGLAFGRHLLLARMKTAAELLEGTDLSVKEISAATGYEHVPSFDRRFRAHFGMTPGEFRHRNRKR